MTFIAEDLAVMTKPDGNCLQTIASRLRKHLQRSPGGVPTPYQELAKALALTPRTGFIRGKPVIEQDFRINLAVRGMGLGFVQDREEVIQHLEKGRHRRLVHGEGYRRGPPLVEVGELFAVRSVCATA